MRDIIILACEECKNRNYTNTRNKRKNPNRMELKKFCPSCRKHTLHKQR
ncbi:MAG: 50S ribosomal protein L33 [Candidatus Cloacimonetes bacterium]|nr:50S ribosomal protein L33 [Candidatus Cloacimonadota bacterium]